MAIGQCLVEEGIHMNEIAIIATEDPDEEAQFQTLEKKGRLYRNRGDSSTA